KATRLFDYIIDKRKTYIAELQLGMITDTQDATGTVLEERAVTVSHEALTAVLPQFIGEIQQIPPMYSAVKQGGRRLYQLARRGEEVERKARTCRVEDISLLEALPNHRYRIQVQCGKGVYIRTLCHDIGAALGCGAHMASLERVSAGIFDIANAYTPEQIDRLCQNGELDSALLPLDAPLGYLPEVMLPIETAHAVYNGNPIHPRWIGDVSLSSGALARLYLGDRFAGIGEMRPDGWIRFRAMLLEDRL
ncbi:MAG: tRNA pseudouridine(55) synthase TruB, partial [Clostridia bacterium]|nr:tRNA pseudouridine(55) synthase TruB [Clostridia bacterium]